MTNWWVGGYGHDMTGTMPGIQAMRSTDAGTLELAGTAVETLSPSYLLQRGTHVYAVAEGAGSVDSFRVAGEHSLVRDGSVSSGGKWPCNLEFVQQGIAVANYFDGVVGLVGLDPSGAVTTLADTWQGSGTGPDERQQGPHSHAVLAVEAGTLLSVDLGADRINLHGPGLEARASVSLPAGTGPRDIRRNKEFLYVLGELRQELFVLRWTGSTLEIVSSVAIPGALEGDSGSGISVHGDFVYTGLRGSNRVAILRASDDGATLEPIGWVSSEGDWPRHHAVDGDVLHVANQLSNSVASFRLGDDGTPRLIAEPTTVPSPNYLLARG